MAPQLQAYLAIQDSLHMLQGLGNGHIWGAIIHSTTGDIGKLGWGQTWESLQMTLSDSDSISVVVFTMCLRSHHFGRCKASTHLISSPRNRAGMPWYPLKCVSAHWACHRHALGHSTQIADLGFIPTEAGFITYEVGHSPVMQFLLQRDTDRQCIFIWEQRLWTPGVRKYLVVFFFFVSHLVAQLRNPRSFLI